MKIELSKEELIEIKKAINTIISERIGYAFHEDHNKKERLKNNKQSIEIDYSILKKIVDTLDKMEE